LTEPQSNALRLHGLPVSRLDRQKRFDDAVPPAFGKQSHGTPLGVNRSAGTGSVVQKLVR